MSAFTEIGKDFMDMFKEINWRKFMTRLIMVIVLCVMVFGGCSYFNQKFGLKDDNIIETKIEDMIESQTGISIDLTPNNPDDDSYDLDMWRED